LWGWERGWGDSRKWWILERHLGHKATPVAIYNQIEKKVSIPTRGGFIPRSTSGGFIWGMVISSMWVDIIIQKPTAIQIIAVYTISKAKLYSLNIIM